MMLSALLCAALAAQAASSPARLEYRLRFDPADTTKVAVTIQVHNAPASMVIAANAHPEYDDKYWRYVENLNAVTVCGEMVPVSRIDSVRWQVHNKGTGDIVIAYQVNFPESAIPRDSWKPFLSPTGGLIGGPHSFLYAIGSENESADVTLDIPSTWKTATGLSSNSRDRTFTAKNIHTLMESPMLVGDLSEWRIDNRHTAFYWKLPNATKFDSTEFVGGISRIVNQANSLFGGAPYDHYAFLIQDGAYSGGLEHPNSVTIGAMSEELAKDPLSTIRELSHEYIHTWNLMSIKPSGYREVDYRVQGPVSELWFSEGLTIFYADLLRRRANIPTEDSTRIAHLEGIIGRYLAQPGNSRFSAEQISRVAYNARPDALGDYSASSHLVGEIIGTVLDLKTRAATDGKKSIDDVMRMMYHRFRDRKFTSKDVERVVNEVCACNASPVFQQHVYNAGAIDFNKYLASLGLTLDVKWKPATQRDGTPAKDLRTWAWQEGGKLYLRVSDPSSVWGKAGLRSGDQLLRVNGAEIKTWPAYRSVLVKSAIGDTLRFDILHDGRQVSRTVVVAGYEEPIVQIREIPTASQRQIQLRKEWMQ
jgi:predicted metalloprotease with PDZ domain